MASTPSLTIACMPNGDADARLWLNSFAACLSRNYESLEVTREKADAIAALVKAFDDALLIASSPATRTQPAIWAKTDARNAAVMAVRDIVSFLRHHPRISDSQRIDLGINPRNTHAERRRRQKDRERRMLSPR